MTPDEFRAAAATISGVGGIAAVAALLHVAPRTVQRWASGAALIPAGVATEVAALLDAQTAATAVLRERVGDGYVARLEVE